IEKMDKQNTWTQSAQNKQKPARKGTQRGALGPDCFPQFVQGRARAQANGTTTSNSSSDLLDVSGKSNTGRVEY
ncbi:Hypothetical predicted protein, partial [Scomber scombrus]